MRVTESQILDLAARSVSDGLSRASETSKVAASGLRVALPSDDPVAWADGMRAVVREQQSSLRASAINTSRLRLDDSETALDTIGKILSQVQGLGVQAGNETQSAGDRAAVAQQIRDLQTQLLNSLNTRDAAGQYVLGGSLGASPAFDATGKFVGDAIDKTVQVGEGQSGAGSVSGSLLTAAGGGVDVYATVDAMALAVEQNDPAAVRAQLDNMVAAIAQVSNARATIGVRIRALDDADSARQDLETTLASIKAQALSADPVKAASDFTAAKNALEAAQQVAQQIVSLTQPH